MRSLKYFLAILLAVLCLQSPALATFDHAFKLPPGYIVVSGGTIPNDTPTQSLIILTGDVTLGTASAKPGMVLWILNATTTHTLTGVGIYDRFGNAGQTSLVMQAWDKVMLVATFDNQWVVYEYSDGFTPANSASPPATYSQPIVFGNTGIVVSAATRYLYPGSAVAAVAEVQIRIPRAMTLASVSVHSTVAPGVGLTDTFTVRKNGSDTALAVSLVGTDVDETTTTNVSFAAGDLLSVKLVSDTLSADTDPMVTIEAY